MVRKSFYIGFSYFAGLFLCTIGWGQNNAVFALAALCIGAAGLAFLKHKRRYVLACLLAFEAAIAVNTVYTACVYDKLADLDGKTVSVSGYILDQSYIGSDTCLVTVKGDIGGRSGQLTFYTDNADFDYYDEVTARVKVSLIKDSITFQSEKYQRPKGVYLKGSNSESFDLTGRNVNPIFREIKHYRDRLFDKITTIIGGDEGGFAAAMLCGDKSEMSAQTKTLIYRSGIGHIFSVSGTHVIIISEMLGWIISRLCRRNKTRFALQMLVVWSFAVFAGLSVPVVRAAAMLTVVKAAPLFYRRPDPGNTLGLCAIVMLTASPYAAADCSFLLSFGAAFAIGVICPKCKALVKRRGRAGTFLRSAVEAVAILLCTMPIQLMFFNEISLVAPISNILLVPICTFALGLTVLTALTGGVDIIAIPVLTAVKWLLKAVIAIAEIFVKVPFAYLPRGVKPLGAVMLISCLLPVVIALHRKSVKLGGICTAAMLICWVGVYDITMALGRDDMKVLVLPKGKAMQAVIYQQDSGAVFDIGSKGKLNSSMERFLECYGINDLKCAFINKERYYTITKYKSQMTTQPDNFYVNGEGESDDEYTFCNGSKLEWQGAEITALDDGYEIDFADKKLILHSYGIELDGRVLDTSKEEYPIMIDLENSEIWRTTYGFAYGFGSW